MRAGRTRRLAVPGARLFVTETGRPEAPPAILVHGGPGIPGYLDGLGEMLGDRAFVVDYRQRGTAKSPSRGPFLVADHVGDLRAVVKAYSSPRRPVIVASSWGAILALRYAARFPGTVRKLILIGTAPLEEPTFQAFCAEIAARLPPDAVARKARVAAGLDDKSLPAARRARLDLEYLKIILPVYNRNRSSFEGIRLEPRAPGPVSAADADYARLRKNGGLLRGLKRIEDPVVAFHGKDDPIPCKVVLAQLSRGIRRFKGRLLENCGHAPWLEKNAAAAFLPLLRREFRG